MCCDRLPLDFLFGPGDCLTVFHAAHVELSIVLAHNQVWACMAGAATATADRPLRHLGTKPQIPAAPPAPGA